MNTFLDALTDKTNYTYTENGAVTHKTSRSDLLDMFALCGAYRNRSNKDCILAFQKALIENELYAMKCLFYLRDIRGGQGERRFFKVCLRWLADTFPEAVSRNLKLIPEYGRWDDLYCLEGTKLESEMFAFIKEQLTLDFECKTPSLLAKWLKSENASSYETKRLGNKTRLAMGMNHRQYRKTLSMLRERINIVERLMSENRWNEIEFDKIPSRAGLIYKNAFARRDIIKEKYESFAKDTSTKVNAEVLNPVDIAKRIYNISWGWGLTHNRFSDTDIAMFQKYWDNLKDYYNGREENGIAIVDVSGSMWGQPICAAVSMGAYIAERGHGPFANHFITFSNNPELVKFEGINIVDKFYRAAKANWGMSTNIEAVFDLLLETAIQNNIDSKDMPETIYIFSDMEFNRCLADNTHLNDGWYHSRSYNKDNIDTLIEVKAREWKRHGYKIPKIIFWNLDARHQNIPAIGPGFSYVSGFNMNMVECILSGKDGYDLMMDKLNTERYAPIY